MRNFTRQGLLWVFIVLLAACSFNPDQLVPPQWDTEFIGPLVRTKSTLDDILEISDQRFEQSFAICEVLDLIDPLICQSGVPVPIPPFGPIDLPEDTVNYTDIYNELLLDSGRLELSISNGLPVDVEAGLLIEIANLTGAPFITFTLTQDLAPNGTATFSQDLAGQSLGSEFILRFKNFETNGSGGPVTINPDARIGFTFDLIALKVGSVNLVPGNEFALGDTSEFTLDDGIVINSEPITGILSYLAVNEFDAAFSVQAYFLNQDQTIVLDTLFSDGSGIITPNSDTVVLKTEVTEETLLNLKEAAWVVTQASWVAISDPPGFDEAFLLSTDTLGLTLVAELKVRVKP